MIITKEVEFPMGHRLQSHPGLCRHIHGHGYRVVVEVESRILNSQGMVIDFSDLKKEMESVFEGYDHAFVIERGDPFGDLRALNENYPPKTTGLSRIIEIEEPPTAENLARHWFRKLEFRIGNEDTHCRVVSVTVYESPTTSAKYERKSD